MDHESRRELWSPTLTTFCSVGFGIHLAAHGLMIAVLSQSMKLGDLASCSSYAMHEKWAFSPTRELTNEAPGVPMRRLQLLRLSTRGKTPIRAPQSGLHRVLRRDSFH
jgi:hypothetical protein